MTERSRNVEIEIFPIAKTVVDETVVAKWLASMNVSQSTIDDVTGDYWDSTDPAVLIAVAAKQCYMAFEPGLNPNVTKVRTDLTEYLDNILKSGHGSVLEHATYSFAINGVSRVFTAEMNRHRAGWAISERSMRYIRFEDRIDWWLPTSIRDDPNDPPGIAERKRDTRLVFHTMFRAMSQAYSELVDLWDLDATDANFHYKKVVTSCLRRIIGMGVATGGVWTGNIRALRHVIAMRASPEAEEEIFHVFSRIAKMMILSEPMLFGDFVEDEKGYWKPKYPKV